MSNRDLPGELAEAVEEDSKDASGALFFSIGYTKSYAEDDEVIEALEQISEYASEALKE